MSSKREAIDLVELEYDLKCMSFSDRQAVCRKVEMAVAKGHEMADDVVSMVKRYAQPANWQDRYDLAQKKKAKDKTRKFNRRHSARR